MEPSGFREIARSATVTYPIPFVFALCLAFSVLTFGGAIVADGLLRWALVAFGGGSMLFAFVTFAIAAIWKPDLLRSERHQISHRVMDFIEDSDLGPETLEASRIILAEPLTKKVAPQSATSRTPDGDHSHGR